MQKQITVPDIGTVLITKKNNATRIKLRVHPEKGVLITIPYYARYNDGKDFLYKNIDWLKEKLKNQQVLKTESIFTPESVFFSRKYSLKFVVHNKDKLVGKIEQNNINLYYNPELVNFEDPEIQKFVKKVILRGLQLEGQVFLKDRIEILSQKTKIKFRSVEIGNAGTRWGCCMGNNDIILSCRLLLLPDELIDYIIIHELCHVIHKDHSSKFHELLDSLVDGRSKQFNRELKKYTTQVKPGNYRYLPENKDTTNTMNPRGERQLKLPFNDQ
jgi:predicted metal-dependent hydrolase